MTDTSDRADAADIGPTRSGFVAIIGAPNAGKSTLVNQLVGTKVSIVSPKVQTTRSVIRGIAMTGATQVVLVDTPGIFEPRRRLDRAMVAAAWGGASDADMVVLVVDAAKGVTARVQAILDGLKENRRPAWLVLNKVDLIAKEALLALTGQLNDTGLFEDVFMISALSGNGCADLLAALAERMPEGPYLFPPDDVSDLPARLLAAEITREKAFLQLRQELPYAVAVVTESFEETDKGIRIDQVLYVQRDSQKPIVLGKGGTRIKAIGQAARQDLEEMFDTRVHLFLHVKVREGWSDSPEHFRDWGLDFNA